MFGSFNNKNTMIIELERKSFLISNSTEKSICKGENHMTQQLNEDLEQIRAILNAIKGLQFGEVHITIQDGVIVQINRLEKQRFSKSKAK